MAIIGTFATVRAQAPGTPGFAAAFAYVESLLQPGSDAAQRLAAMAAGETAKRELGGGVFAIDQVYLSKPRPEGFFESHRRLIDVQVIVAGEELMEFADIARLAVRDAYNPERDLVVYADFAGAAVLPFRAGETAVYFPADGHMPGLQPVAGRGLVRKTVVKIPVDA